MRDFFLLHKKASIIILSVFAAVAAAVAATVIILNITKGAVTSSEGSLLSDVSSTPYIESSSTPAEDVGPQLQMTSLTGESATTNDSFYVFTGTSDPAHPLLLDGAQVDRTENGAFSVQVNLKVGQNKFTFEHKGKTYTYTVTYNYVLVKGYAPSTKQSYEAGSVFAVTVLARKGCTVTAQFNGSKINLSATLSGGEEDNTDDTEFVNFTGTFTLPTKNDSNLNLGGVKITASGYGTSATYKTPSITCLRDASLDRTYVVEIVADHAETFNGGSADDASRPTNAYLPKGTVDYKVGGIAYDSSSGNRYYNMRYGKMVYIDKKNSPDTSRNTVSKIYEGQLPDTNEVSLAAVSRSGHHTVLTFDTAWKAPFELDIGPQSYYDAAAQDYRISRATYTYVDIKFCYTQAIGGDMSAVAGMGVFSYAEVLPAQGGCVVRLHLKSTGAFYGWDSRYNDKGQLEFSFLDAVAAGSGENEYGTDLTGIKIMIDAGHGGRDPGALGVDGKNHPESERNLNLAKLLKAELLKMNATVIMMRETDTAVSADERCVRLRKAAPDLCISIHHNSSENTSANGCGVFCFDAFSNSAMNAVFNRINAGEPYQNVYTEWHVFYLARVSSCPVVLTENGYISNLSDFSGITDSSVNAKKAQQIAQGIADYFKSIN